MSAFHDNALMGASGSQGYTISRSVRLRSSASAYFNRTPASTGNQKTFTISAWVKISQPSSAKNYIYTSGVSSYPSIANNYTLLDMGSSGFSNSTNYLEFVSSVSGVTQFQLQSTAVYRDPSAWYHLVVAVDTTQATASNRIKMYVNGVQVTSFSTASYPSQNLDIPYFNSSSYAQYIGQVYYYGSMDGYLTEYNFIDGQALTPSSFGETDAVTGVWKPKKYGGTYGTNGFYLNFSDNSSNTAATIGKDYSGNGNNWTPNNISVTSGVTYDSMIDVPTPYADGGNGRGNYAVMNPLAKSSVGTLDNANMRWTCGNSGGGTAGNGTRVSIGINSGKWYAECTVLDTVFWSYPGISNESHSTSTYNGGDANSWSVSSSGQKVTNNSASAYGSATWAANDIVNIAYDADNGELYFGKNGTWLNSGNPATRTNPAFTGLSGTQFFTIGFSSNTASTSQVAFNCGQQPFTYTPPTGFKALNTFNLPAVTINNGAQYMAATTYTGTGSALTIANTVGSASFQPDLVWVKGRSGATDHAWYDAVRGVQLQLESNTTTAETTETTGLTAFGSTGFTIGALAQMNTSAATYVAWQWKESASAGFDIVTYTGNGTNRTIAHSLGVAPSMIIIKCRDSATDPSWIVGHTGIVMGTGRLILNGTDANSNAGASSLWNSTAANSSVFSLGTYSSVNQNTLRFVAYLFSDVAGFSKFGSYTGNGSADGPFVYLGFRPRWILLKRTDSSFGGDWEIWDTSRSTYNAVNAELYANSSSSESSATNPDILSNGFKIRSSAANYNASGGTYVYACFAENPYKLALAR